MACHALPVFAQASSRPAAPHGRASAPITRLARRRVHLAPARAASAAPSTPSATKFWCETVPSTRQAEALKNTAVILAADAAEATVPVTAFVAQGGERPPRPSMLVVARSLGCPFCQNLARGLVTQGVLADLDAAGVSLYLVSIGVPSKARAFCDLTGFPPARLLADGGASVYAALGLERGFGAAFLSPTTPAAIGAEIKGGGGSALAASLKEWVPFLPPKPLEHALAQGGTFAFSGGVCVAARADRATADHLPPARIKEIGLGLVKVT